MKTEATDFVRRGICQECERQKDILVQYGTLLELSPIKWVCLKCFNHLTFGINPQFEVMTRLGIVNDLLSAAKRLVLEEENPQYIMKLLIIARGESIAVQTRYMKDNYPNTYIDFNSQDFESLKREEESSK